MIYKIEIRMNNAPDMGHGKNVLATGEIEVFLPYEGAQNKAEVLKKVLEIASDFRNKICHVVVLPLEELDEEGAS